VGRHKSPARKEEEANPKNIKRNALDCQTEITKLVEGTKKITRKRKGSESGERQADVDV